MYIHTPLSLFIYIHTYLHTSLSIYICIYIYIYVHIDTVGSPRRAQNHQFELFQLIIRSKLDKRFPVEQFDPTVSPSTVLFPPLRPPEFDGRGCPTELGGLTYGDFSCGRATLSHEDPL